MARSVLSAAQRSRVRRLAVPGANASEGELNVVPFLDIIVNVLIFVLATLAVTFTASVVTRPPRAHVFNVGNAHGLDLTVLVVDHGFAIKAAGGNVAPGCNDMGPGLAIPRRAGRYDFGALGACVAKLKHELPQAKDTSQAFLAANPATDYQTIVSTLDALRTAPDGELLFDDVVFKVPE